MTSTLSEYLESQEELVKEAALALPHEFSKCTYSLGPIRQAVYLCLTCPEQKGLCSACSIACHTDHEQVELFPKRNFRCDCPTTAVKHPCTLHKGLEEENTSNIYGHNFRAEFCRCGRPYDAKTEQEVMIQCLMCEDWFHESCCNLREQPSSKEAPPTSENAIKLQDDTESDTSDLPSPLISEDDYESFICGLCVSVNPTLKRWAGTPGLSMIVRDSPQQSWRCLVDEESGVYDACSSPSIVGVKRPLSPSDTGIPEAKRVRGKSPSSELPGTCLAPPRNSIAAEIFICYDPLLGHPRGRGDIFLSEGFRSRWCHCNSCLPSIKPYKFLFEEETTYEPPEDPDLGLSFEELGMRALERLPRDKAIEGIHAFNGMRDNLIKFLRPFADEGKVVDESDVRAFFQSLTPPGKNK